MRKRLLIVYYLVAVTGGFSQGISLGEEARRERERQRPSAAIVITNADVRSSASPRHGEILRLSGADQLIDTVSSGFVQAVKPQSTQYAPVVREELRSVALESLDPAKLMAVLERRFSAELDEASLVEAQLWYSSPAGSRIAAAKQDAAADKTSLPETRTRLLMELDYQTQRSARLTTTFVMMMKAMTSQMFAGNSEFEQNRENFLGGLEAGFRKGAAPQIQQHTMATYAAAYRSVSDEDLMEYLVFLKTPVGQNLMRALWAGVQEATVSGAGECGQRTAEILKRQDFPK